MPILPIHKSSLLVASILLMYSFTVCAAQSGEQLFVSKGCIVCHGAQGKSPMNDHTPRLAMQNKAYLVQQITDIASGRRDNGGTLQMKPVADKLDTGQISAIADYLSGLE